MKIKTNIRAGAGKQKRKSGGESEAPAYVPPVSRCVGI